MMREWAIRKALGDKALRIRVDPGKITHEMRQFAAQDRRLRLLAHPAMPEFAKPLVNRAIWELNRFQMDEVEFHRAPIDRTPVFLRMQDVSDHRDALEDSQTYRDIVNAIKAGGSFRHKNYKVTDPQDAVDCIRACFLDIIQSMETQGYLADRTSEFATGGLGNAFIDRDGTVLKGIAASHRIAAAKIVNMQGGFPLRVIGAHRDWLEDNGIKGLRDIARLGPALRALEVQDA